MIILFLCTNILLCGLYVLMVNMLGAYFKHLHNSIIIYTNKKVYKSYKEIEFIDNLVKEYNDIKTLNPTGADIDLYILRRIRKDYIGHFKYSFIENSSKKVQMLMLVILAIHTILYFIQGSNIVHLGINVGIVLFMVIFAIFTDITAYKSEVMIIVKDYIINQYSLESTTNKLNETNKKLSIENRHLKESLVLKSQTINKQQELIEELEEIVDIDKMYKTNKLNVS
ncbi:MAG: hypothetical protein BEN19_00330 [Epulopiscium sp. Nuni2H_MBin003]|nr:MAG: hypothetical protein BEN19_00330 [Epulopiscium sp. Nuni2H_MBin003]